MQCRSNWESFSGENSICAWALASARGTRTYMCDAYTVKPEFNGDPSTALFAVFDGHGGGEVARYCASHLPDVLAGCSEYEQGEMGDALSTCFLTLDDMMMSQQAQAELYELSQDVQSASEGTGGPLLAIEPPPTAALSGAGSAAYGRLDPISGFYLGPTCGCTATVALVKGGLLHVAAVGDSRCVLCEGGRAVQLTHDHKPGDLQEKARITKAGLFAHHGRLCGRWGVSRALGDSDYKPRDLLPQDQPVTALPETISLGVGAAPAPLGRSFAVIACDALWAAFGNQQVIDFVQGQLHLGLTPLRVAEELVADCLTAGRTLNEQGGQAQGSESPTAGLAVVSDNITVILLVFKDAC